MLDWEYSEKLREHQGNVGKEGGSGEGNMEYNDVKREERIMHEKGTDGVGMGGQDKWRI